MVTSSKRAYAIPKSAAPRAPARQQSTADPDLHRRPSNTVLSQFLWGLWVLVCIRFIWALWTSLMGMGFYSKREFTPPTIWVNSGSWWWTGRPGVLRSMGSQRVGHDWATELNWTEPSCWGFSFALGHGVSPQSWSSAVQPLLQHLPSCWDFSHLGCGVSSHGCSSAVQL